jgi:hypothetical protein
MRHPSAGDSGPRRTKAQNNDDFDMDSRFSYPTNDGYDFQSMDESYPSASTDSTPVTVTTMSSRPGSTTRNMEEESTTTPGGFYMIEDTKVGRFKKGRCKFYPGY